MTIDSDDNPYRKKHTYDPFVMGVEPIEIDPRDEPLHCVAFNERWLPVVLGSLRPLTWDETWIAPDAVQIQQAEYATRLLTMFMNDGSCIMFFLRQNPSDPCQLQYSQDGELWFLAFDYSLCLNQPSETPPVSITDLERIRELLQDLRDLYNGNINNVIENTIDTHAYFNAAMCLALDLLIHATSQMLIATKRQKEANAVDKVFDAFSPFLVSLLIFAGVPTLLAGFVAAVYVIVTREWVMGTIDSITIEELEDQDAINDVICVAYNNLRDGLIPTITELRDAFDPVQFATGTPAAYIAETMYRMAGEGSDFYLGFIDYIDDTYELAEAGLLADNCLPCVTSSCWAWDFTETSDGWNAFTGNAVYAAPYWDTVFSTHDRVYIENEMLFDQIITQVSITYEGASSAAYPNSEVFAARNGVSEANIINSPRVRYENGVNTVVFDVDREFVAGDKLIVGLFRASSNVNINIRAVSIAYTPLTGETPAYNGGEAC